MHSTCPCVYGFRWVTLQFRVNQSDMLHPAYAHCSQDSFQKMDGCMYSLNFN